MSTKIKGKKAVEQWGCEEVFTWLENSGFKNYASLISREHKIDGAALILLSENDLRLPPLQIPYLGDVKRLYQAIQGLKNSSKTSDANGSSQSVPLHPKASSSPVNGFRAIENGVSRPESPTPIHVVSSYPSLQHITDSDLKRVTVGRALNGDILIARVESPDTPTKSLIKTGISAIYCSISLLLTSLVMVIVHDRVPDMKTYPPLPDLFLDNVPLIPWAFEVCELLACILAGIWMVTLVFHKHRVVLMCRMFSLTGTVFLLRCITMLITSLSVPGVHLECSAKNYADFTAKFYEAFRIWSGMGMSLRGVRSCGDYMFSGHTTAITLLNHFITEYTPDSFLHTITWVMNLFGIFFILAGHEHYSIDVFVAFYISSRMFLYYHSMASQGLNGGDHRTRMWFPLFWLFESGRPGRIPNEYEWPLPSWNQVSGWLKEHLYGECRDDDCFQDYPGSNSGGDSISDKQFPDRRKFNSSQKKNRWNKQKAKGD